MNRIFVLACVLLLPSLGVLGQTIAVNQQNKTISVTADDTVEVQPDVARVSVGYNNYAPTQDAAFQDNVRVAEQVTKALLDAGVAKGDIETDNIRLDRLEPDEKWTKEERQQRQYQATQSWRVRIPAAAGEKIVAAAVHAGANYVSDVAWDVGDQAGLQAQASAKALEKARRVAQQMAAGLGAKLGALIYASNRAPAPSWLSGISLETQASVVTRPSAAPPPPPSLKLYPKKVTAEATVYAVFAIE